MYLKVKYLYPTDLTENADESDPEDPEEHVFCAVDLVKVMNSAWLENLGGCYNFLITITGYLLSNSSLINFVNRHEISQFLLNKTLFYFTVHVVLRSRILLQDKNGQLA